MSVIAVLSVNMVTANMLLSVFFVSGALAACSDQVDLFITTPKKMEALNGSCLQIPCNFRAKSEQEFNSSRQNLGVWIKNDSRFGHDPNNVIFKSSETVNKYPMSLTGDLSQKNCTTLFSSLNSSYTDTYFFRVENGAFKATASCDPLQITVTDSAPSPRIEIPGDLKEKQSVTITCSAATPCPHSPPKLTWNLQQGSHNKIEQNTDVTFTTKIQETITLSDQHDGYDITCSASYPVNGGKEVKTAEERKTLSVSYPPKDTSVSISPSGLVSAGSRVELNCSSRAKPPISSFTWFKKSKDGAMRVSEGERYSFNVTDGGVYYCVATNDLGNETSSVNVPLEGKSLPWRALLGGITGITALICLVVCVWQFKSKHQTPQQTQSQRGDELALQMPASKREENIHYREIHFAEQRPGPSSDSVHGGGQQQETLYAQVRVSEQANSSAQAADGPEVLYAQVMKK